MEQSEPDGFSDVVECSVVTSEAVGYFKYPPRVAISNILCSCEYNISNY